MPDVLFDSQKFLQSLANDEELAAELLAAFMEDSPSRTASLKEALATNDEEASSKLAHSLKGMCGVVRAQPLVEMALTMEQASKAGDLDKVREVFAKFTELLDKAHAEMKDFSA